LSIDYRKLREAEELIAKAKTPTELAAAHAALKASIRKNRVVAKKEFGPLAETYGEAMKYWDAQKEQGVSLEVRIESLANILKQVWPHGRPWRHVCEKCQDTGWQRKICKAGDRCDGQSTFSHSWNSPAGSKRRICTLQDSYEHEYVEPCHCGRGNDARATLSASLSNGSRRSAMDDAGSSRKMTRIGR
jgi:hypothetical protein